MALAALTFISSVPLFIILQSTDYFKESPVSTSAEYSQNIATGITLQFTGIAFYIALTLAVWIYFNCHGYCLCILHAIAVHCKLFRTARHIIIGLAAIALILISTGSIMTVINTAKYLYYENNINTNTHYAMISACVIGAIGAITTISWLIEGVHNYKLVM